MPGVQAGLKPGAVQAGAGCARRGAAAGVIGGAGSASSGPRLLPVSGAGCPPSRAPPGRAGTQPRRAAHRARGGLSPWLAVSRPPARPACPAACRPGRREDDSGATLVPGWRPGELADVIRRLLRGLLAACRLASDGVAGTGGRQLTAMGSRAGQYRQLRGLGAAGPPGSLPRRRARLCPDAGASAVSRQPGRPPGRCLAGTPAALPRARPGPAAAAGSRIVHLLRCLRRP
jgi:hypothetical protein